MIRWRVSQLVPLSLTVAVVFFGGKRPAVGAIASDGADGGSLAWGRALLAQGRCASCHEGLDRFAAFVGNAPDLRRAAAWRSPDALARRILNPTHGRMPHLLGGVAPIERDATVHALVSYLVAHQAPPPPEESLQPGARERGRTLYNQIGCIACHGADLDAPSEEGGWPSGWTAAGLVAFLEDPLKARPDGSMPHVALDHWEAMDLVAFLLRDRTVRAADPSEVESEAVLAGAESFRELRCSACHAAPDGVADAPRRLPAPTDWAAGCLSETPSADAPHYGFSLTESEALGRAWRAGSMDAEGRLAMNLIRFDCVACHTRDGVGGPSEATLSTFATDNPNLGEAARRPPTLNGVGAKFSEAILFDIIAYGASHRPYMLTRMPAIGPENARNLAADFALLDGEWEPTPPNPDLNDRDAQEAGVVLVGTDGLGCVTCHTFDGRNASELNAVDLTTMAERLDRGWFEAYLRDPTGFQSDTIMPSFWPGGESTRPDVLGGKTADQIEALWRYLSRGRQARTPKGLRREPIPLRATADRAILLRRAYRGIGKRGIGVGYPLGVNLAFDAGRLRLASIWQGDFGDASGVWLSQGHGVVGEGARRVLRFPQAPAVARLPSESAPWPRSDAEFYDEFQFLGYVLDEQERPTFRYTFEELLFEDQFLDRLDERGKAFLERWVRFGALPEPGIRMRLGVDSQVSSLNVQRVRLEELGLVLDASAPLKTRSTPEGATEVWVDLEGLSQLKVQYHWEAR